MSIAADSEARAPRGRVLCSNLSKVGVDKLVRYVMGEEGAPKALLDDAVLVSESRISSLHLENLRTLKTEPRSLPVSTSGYFPEFMRSQYAREVPGEHDVEWYFDGNGLPIMRRILQRICNQGFSQHTQWGLSQTSAQSDHDPATELHRTASEESISSQDTDDSALGLEHTGAPIQRRFVPMVPQALLPRGVLDGLIGRVMELCKEEPNVVELSQPVTIFGDLHGQFIDLLSAVHHSKDLDSTGALRSSKKWLFLGDYVDRGCHGIEIIAYLFALKVRYPNQVFLLRGNHESRAMTYKTYVEGISFSQECAVKYSASLYVQMMRCFDALPLAAIVTVGGPIDHGMSDSATARTDQSHRVEHGSVCSESEQLRFFCSHGGISPGGKTIAQLQAIDRFREPPLAGPFCDLVWSDPLPETGVETMTDAEYETFLRTKFVRNSVRGCSWMIGYELVREFLARNNLAGVVRGHQVAKAGVSFHFSKTREGAPLRYPMYTTVFSAPNYCGQYTNRGAIIKIDDHGNYVAYRYTRPEDVSRPASVPVIERDVDFDSSDLASSSLERELREELHPGIQSLRASVKLLVQILSKNAVNQNAPLRTSGEAPQTGVKSRNEATEIPARRSFSRVSSIEALKELSTAISREDREQLRYVFAALDQNNDGFLGPSERDDLLTMLRGMLEDDNQEDELRAFVESIESSEAQLISFEEFVSWAETGPS